MYKNAKCYIIYKTATAETLNLCTAGFPPQTSLQYLHFKHVAASFNSNKLILSGQVGGKLTI